MTHKLLALYGLKYNPFLPDLPNEGLWQPPGWKLFQDRLESLLAQGGFALLWGEPGLGKSKALQLLSLALERNNGLLVGVMERPQSSLSDFYREMGELFGVPLSPANRYGGFKALRARWRNHFKDLLLRPVLLIDEAQEMDNYCFCELRLLGSMRFDSECLLTAILCGDSRLVDRFRSRELLSLGTRIRVRHALEPLSREDLLDYLRFSLDQAGAPHLLTEPLMLTLAEHCAGNLRILTNMGAELLAVAVERQLPVLDESLFLEVYSKTLKPRRRA